MTVRTLDLDDLASDFEEKRDRLEELQDEIEELKNLDDALGGNLANATGMLVLVKDAQDFAEEHAGEEGWYDVNSPIADCIDFDQLSDLMFEDATEVEYDGEAWYVYEG